MTAALEELALELPELPGDMRAVAASGLDSWLRAVQLGLVHLPLRLEQVLLTDSGVQFMNHSVAPLLHRLQGADAARHKGEEGARVAVDVVASVGIYPDSTVHSAGGNTEFMKEHNSFLVPVSHYEPFTKGPQEAPAWQGVIKLVKDSFTRDAAVPEQQEAAMLASAGDILLFWLIGHGRYGLVILQHEFGLFGPKPHGDHVVCLLRRIQSPVLTVLHTIHKHLEDPKHALLRRIHELSDHTVVMTGFVRKLLSTQFMISNVSVIPHGVPAVEFSPATEIARATFRARHGWNDRIVLISNGLLHHGKGFEDVIRVLPGLRAEFPEVLYVIVGKPHPVAGVTGQNYLRLLQSTAAVAKLGVEEHNLTSPKQVLRSTQILFFSDFVPYEHLLQLLRAADIFVAPYTNDQISNSGTLSTAMACGLVPVATRFLYAAWVLQHRRGNERDISQKLSMLIANKTLRSSLAKAAKDYATETQWDAVAASYLSFL
eukprot:gene11486-13575_t